ncbi:hypothetical protein G647_02080 [Cladophialophora carrionii CBS 160.54]|uniref:Uncharacterized protein n=1 Tax=Cladophialophora carrionii CBS 160.54 TaxID=1279043 RepID=V9DG49_9EURO|nr:uncharacterized protein G647_02080 [Cladophialophora carrionii CBS 160.54]ETI25308.1 hypothetical protein G647_02080 [Cladophialophora carrionii CBS 160.54]
MRQRFKESNLTIETLSGQLITVRAALSQINLLIVESLSRDEQHYQLTLDLSAAIGCCNLLLRLLDEQLAKLQYNDTDEVTFLSKVNLMLESKGTEDCLTRLDRQINALNLLVTAFKCRNPRVQQEFLQETESRSVFDQVRDDSTSLIVVCDSASIVTQRTRTTTGTSRFSANFSFDAEILQANAYKATLRSLMRRAQNDNSRERYSQNTRIKSPDGPTLRKLPRRVKISRPENLMHVTHVRYDVLYGRYTVSRT